MRLLAATALGGALMAMPQPALAQSEPAGASGNIVLDTINVEGQGGDGPARRHHLGRLS